jgi:hypothetical protein
LLGMFSTKIYVTQKSIFTYEEYYSLPPVKDTIK